MKRQAELKKSQGQWRIPGTNRKNWRDEVKSWKHSTEAKRETEMNEYTKWATVK